ncbi:MAG: acetyltransferase [Candidatus Methylacidiphilales bacterium]
MRDACVLIGAGGHGGMVLEILEDQHPGKVQGIIDANPSAATKWGLPFLGDDSVLHTLAERGFRYFALGLGSIGSGTRRRDVYMQAAAAGLSPIDIRAGTAIVSPLATIGAGAQLMPRSLVNRGAVLGQNVLINSGAIVEHDCLLEDHIHVATGAILCGGVRVGSNVHIGAGAVVRQGLTIGECSVIGAGAVVVKDVLGGSLMLGVPAQPRERIG